MAKPVKIKYDGSSNFIGLQEMSTSEIDVVADFVLSKWVSGSTTVGKLLVNSNPGSWSNQGSHSDTYRPNSPGSHPVGTTINSTNYVVYQNLINPSRSLSNRALKIKYDGSSNFAGLQDMSDSDVVGDIIGRCKIKLATSGIGSYKFQISAPSGGTWTQSGTIKDTRSDGTNTSAYLWRRTNTTSMNSTRPVGWDDSNNRVKELTDGELDDLVSYLEYEIVNSGVGQYKLSAAAPSGGTWIQVGDAFTDTRHNVANQNYTGSYTGSYIRYYSGVNYGTYTGTYTGYYTGLTVQSSTTNVSTMKLWLRTA
jgi:hypothetical protein